MSVDAPTSQYRGVVKAGRLEVGTVVFTTVPALYNLTTGEASRLRHHWGERLTLDLMEDPPQINQDDQAITGSAPSGQVLPPEKDLEIERPTDTDPPSQPEPEPEPDDGVAGLGEPGSESDSQPDTDVALGPEAGVDPPQNDNQAIIDGAASEPDSPSDAENYNCPQCDVRHKRESGIGQEHAHLATGGSS